LSAFICEDQIINEILSYLYNDFSISSNDRLNIFEDMGYVLRHNDSDQDPHEPYHKLGAAFLELNCKAVSHRYNEITIEIYHGFKFVPVTIHQALKSARCLLYQCSEGKYPNHDLYKALEKLIDSFMYEIITELPEYKEAHWGVIA